MDKLTTTASASVNVWQGGKRSRGSDSGLSALYNRELDQGKKYLRNQALALSSIYDANPHTARDELQMNPFLDANDLKLKILPRFLLDDPP